MRDGGVFVDYNREPLAARVSIAEAARGRAALPIDLMALRRPPQRRK